MNIKIHILCLGIATLCLAQQNISETDFGCRVKVRTEIFKPNHPSRPGFEMTVLTQTMFSLEPGESFDETYVESDLIGGTSQKEFTLQATRTKDGNRATMTLMQENDEEELNLTRSLSRAQNPKDTISFTLGGMNAWYECGFVQQGVNLDSPSLFRGLPVYQEYHSFPDANETNSSA